MQKFYFPKVCTRWTQECALSPTRSPDRGMCKSTDYGVFCRFYVTPAASIKPKITSSHHNRGEKGKKMQKLTKFVNFGLKTFDSSEKITVGKLGE